MASALLTGVTVFIVLVVIASCITSDGLRMVTRAWSRLAVSELDHWYASWRGAKRQRRIRLQKDIAFVITSK